MNTMQELQRRLDTLEHEVIRGRQDARRYRTVCFGLAGAIVAGVCLAAAARQSVHEVIQARRFEVVDTDGRVVAATSAGPRGGQIDLWTSEGQNIFRAWSNDSGGDLAMWNNAGRNIFGAFATPAGGEAGVWSAKGARVFRIYATEHGGRMVLLGPKDRPAVTAYAGESGGHLSLQNTMETTVFAATAHAGGGSLHVNNSKGQAVICADADQDGAGLLEVANAAGRPCLRAEGRTEGGVTQLINRDGNVVAALGVSGSGDGGFVELFNAAGSQIFSARSRSIGSGCSRSFPRSISSRSGVSRWPARPTGLSATSLNWRSSA